MTGRKSLNFSLRQEAVLTYLKQHDSITTTEATQLLKLGKSRTVEILSDMLANGSIAKSGIGRTTDYHLPMI